MTFLVAYYDRLNIALAMPLIAAENGWTDAETASNGALLMGLFYAGFGIANIFLTPFGTRAGPRRSLIVIILLWSLFTALGALASQVMMIFMASRVLLGLSANSKVCCSLRTTRRSTARRPVWRLCAIQKRLSP